MKCYFIITSFWMYPALELRFKVSVLPCLVTPIYTSMQAHQCRKNKQIFSISFIQVAQGRYDPFLLAHSLFSVTFALVANLIVNIVATLRCHH